MPKRKRSDDEDLNDEEEELDEADLEIIKNGEKLIESEEKIDKNKKHKYNTRSNNLFSNSLIMSLVSASNNFLKNKNLEIEGEYDDEDDDDPIISYKDKDYKPIYFKSPPPEDSEESRSWSNSLHNAFINEQEQKRKLTKPKYKEIKDKEKIKEIKDARNKKFKEDEKKIKKYIASIDSKDISSNDIIDNENLNEDEKEELLLKYAIYSDTTPSPGKLYLLKSLKKELRDVNLTPELLKIKKRIEELNNYDKNLEIKFDSSEKNTLLSRILSLNVDDQAKLAIYKKFKQWSELSSQDDNESKDMSIKLKEWIDFAISIPTTVKPLIPEELKTKEKCIEFLANTKKVLDENLYGMKKEKEEILLIINSMLINPSSKFKNLGFVGGPGIGKTELIRSIAKACGLEFEQISLGGCQNVSYLEGHEITYINAKPGIIAKVLSRMKNKSGIIYFDEFDKIGQSSHGEEVMFALLHILDPTQNFEYRDKYLDDLKIDLSNIWFMFSMNDEKRLDRILLDRMHIIRVDPQTKDDKLTILKKFSIPKYAKNSNISLDDFVIDDSVLSHLIKFRIDEANGNLDGMRTLNNDINSIMRRLNMLKTLSDEKSVFNNSLDFSFIKDIPKHMIKFPKFKITEEILMKFITKNISRDNRESIAHIYS